MSYRYYNTLEIIGDEKQIQAVKEFIRGGQDEMGQEIYFDLNKIINMPANISNDYEELVKNHPNPRLYCNDDEVKLWNETLDRYYNWCHENWGCKYNPFDQEMNEDNVISYTTVNGSAIIMVEKLSVYFPEVVLVFMSLCQSPDDVIYHFKNGEILKYEDYDYFVNSTLFYRVHSKIQSKIESELFESSMNKIGKELKLRFK